MPPDFENDMHDLVAAVRAVAASLIDQNGGFGQNFQLGVDAYSRGPFHALCVTAQIAALRLFQIDRARVAQGLEAMPFPLDDLAASRAGQSSAGKDAIAFLSQWVDAPPAREPIEALMTKHGLPGFMMLVQVANEIGTMLVDVDPRFEDLPDLLRKEALADELDWAAWPPD